jgi:thiol-disulfide isomerase/thioredoxin
MGAFTAVGAGAVGVALGWKRFAPEPALPQAQMDFWGSSVLKLNGEDLPMSPYLGRPLLVNFWATWCPPCVEELPLIERYFQQHRATAAVLAIAVDNTPAVQQFCNVCR